MSEWIHSNVGAVTLYQRAGGTPTATTDAYYGGEIPFVTIEDITNGTRYLDKTIKNLSELGLNTSAAWLIKEPHILYSMYATVGKPIINRITCATSQAIIALKESDAIDQTYLFYQLLHIRPEVYKFTSQTTQSNLNAASVRRLPVAYPKRKESQRKIAAILSTIDTAIEQTEALIEKYQYIKAGLMHDLFTRGVLGSGQLRPPRKQAPELYQETAIGWIPREWSLFPLQQIADVLDAQPDHRTPQESINGIPYVGIGDFDAYQELSLDTCRKVVKEAYDKQRQRFEIQTGDVIFGKIGTIGQPKRLPFGGYAVSANVILLKPKIDALYFYYSVCSSAFEKQISNITNTTSQPALGIEKVRNVQVATPETSESTEIGKRLHSVALEIASERRLQDKLKKQKIGLMQDLLTGKVPVTVDASPSETAT
jgi:type I restriction enzyme S subunit